MPLALPELKPIEVPLYPTIPPGSAYVQHSPEEGFREGYIAHRVARVWYMQIRQSAGLVGWGSNRFGGPDSDDGRYLPPPVVPTMRGPSSVHAGLQGYPGQQNKGNQAVPAVYVPMQL